MSTKAEFLAGLRIRLDDTGSKRWQDTELNTYLVDAARDYSKYFPLRKEEEFTADGTANRFDVPSDLIDDQIQRLVLINDETSSQEVIPHKQLRRRGSNRYYEIVGEALVFGFVPEVDLIFQVRYNATHTMPDTGSSTIPFEDEDLIYAYGMAVAWQRIGGNDAGLSRWTEDKKRDDSPLIPHYVRLWSRYTRLIEQKQSIPRTYRRIRTRGTWRDNWET